MAKEGSIFKIDLTDKYYVTFDGRNYTLIQLQAAEKSGKVYEKPLGYYGTMLKAMMAYLDKTSTEKGNGNLENTIKELINTTMESEQRLREVCSKLDLRSMLGSKINNEDEEFEDEFKTED